METIFPYFFVGTFIEAPLYMGEKGKKAIFPYFFVGTFIEASILCAITSRLFPISLLFRRDFH